MADTGQSCIQLRHQFQNLVRFVPSTSTCDRHNYYRKLSAPIPSDNGLSGSEARSFYEHVLSESPSQHWRQKRQSSTKNEGRTQTSGRRKKTKLSKSHGSCIEFDEHDKMESSTSPHRGDKPRSECNMSKRCVNKLLRCAQNGDITNLRRCLEMGTPVDGSDEFGWTPLMCAVHAGHANIVKYLLGVGADINISDSQGRTVFSLSHEQRHENVLGILQDFQRYGSDNWNKGVPAQHNSKFYCDSCQSEFTTSESEHSRSLVHQITSKRTVKPDPFLIPESNKGYKLMQKSGWDGESGLGPEGQGKKFPVKTVLKKDRSCLGTGKPQNAKVTHFKQNDTKAVEHIHKPLQRIMSVRTMSKRARLAKERKNKQWERNMRLHFNTD